MLTGNQTCTREYAKPTVRRLGKHNELALVTIGDLDDESLDTLLSIFGELQAADDLYAVILAIDCHHAEVTPSKLLRAAKASWQLRLAKRTIAHIANAGGLAAYTLAAPCNLLWAAPCSLIGRFDCIVNGESDELLRLALEAQLTEHRPQIQPEALAQCATSLFTGEAAESKWARLVDGLCETPEQLIADLHRQSSYITYV